MADRKPRLDPRTVRMVEMEGGYPCFCGARTAVIDSRRSGDTLRRRRECPSCGTRVSTYEIAVEGSEGLIARAEHVARHAERVMAAATELGHAIESLRRLCDAHKEIATAHGRIAAE